MFVLFGETIMLASPFVGTLWGRAFLYSTYVREMRVTVTMSLDRNAFEKENGIGSEGGNATENATDQASKSKNATENATKNATDEATMELSEKEKAIFDLLLVNPCITVDELVASLGKHRATIIRLLNRLKEKGFIERVGSNRAGHWKIKK